QERVAEASQDIQERLAESRMLAEQQMGAADDYARELLERLRAQLTAFMRSIEAGIEQLQPSGAPPAPYVPPRRPTARPEDGLDVDLADGARDIRPEGGGEPVRLRPGRPAAAPASQTPRAG